MSYPITDIDGIDGDVAVALKSVGIRSSDRLLEAARTVKGRKSLAEKTGFDEKQLLCWANVADRMRIKGVRKEYAELLQAAGVDTVKELKYRNPCNLAKAMADANKKRKLVRLCRRKKSSNVGSRTPGLCRSRSPTDGLTHCLTGPRRPRKATHMGSVRPLEKSIGTTPKSASNALTALFSLGRPLVMGILNVTPDSFSDGGQFMDPGCGGRARC